MVMKAMEKSCHEWRQEDEAIREGFLEEEALRQTIKDEKELAEGRGTLCQDRKKEAHRVKGKEDFNMF